MNVLSRLPFWQITVATGSFTSGFGFAGALTEGFTVGFKVGFALGFRLGTALIVSSGEGVGVTLG